MYLWIRFVKGSSNFFPNLGSRGQRAPNYKKGKMWKITNVLIKNGGTFLSPGNDKFVPSSHKNNTSTR